jgi:cytochrome c-type biogenesis protein CcmF
MLRVAAVAALLGGLALPWLMGAWSPLVALGLALAVWIAASGALQIRARLKVGGAPPASFWGMQLAHLGIAVFVAGVTLVKGYEVEKDVRMVPGDTVEVGAYTVRVLGVRQVPGPNSRAQRGEVELTAPGVAARRLYPEKRAYFSSQMPMTETAIDSGFTRDVYVSLGEPLSGEGANAWSVRVYYKPFVVWIWGGCLLMACGGALAAGDRRYRLKKTRSVLQGVPA